MCTVSVPFRKYLTSRPSRRYTSTTSSNRTSTSPERRNVAEPAVSAELKSFFEIPGPLFLPILRHAYHVLPRIGSFHHTVGLGLLEGLRDKYGNLVRLGKAFRSRPVLYVFDPDIMRQVYESGVTEPPRWERSPLRQHREAVGDRCPGHSQTSQAIWAAVRALLQDEVLLRNYERAFDEIASDFTQRLEKLRHIENALNDELETEIYRWATETIGVLIFGKRLGCLDGPTHIPTAENRPPEKTSLDDHIPELCSLLRRPIEELTPAEQLVRFSRVIADNNYLVRSESTLKTESETFKEAVRLLDAHFSLTEEFLKKALLDVNSKKLRPEQALLDQLRPLGARMLPFAADVMLAGVEPLAASALTMVHRVSLHAAAQQRALDDAAWARAGGAGPLRYVAACAREALRSHAPTGGVLRRATEGLAVAGYHIPAGVDIVLAHGVTSKCEKQWARGTSFVPERWCAEDWQPLRASRAHPCASMPFGELCPATGVVTNMLTSLAARLLDTFRVEWHGPAPRVTTAGVNRLQPPFYFVLKKAA